MAQIRLACFGKFDTVVGAALPFKAQIPSRSQIEVVADRLVRVKPYLQEPSVIFIYS